MLSNMLLSAGLLAATVLALPPGVAVHGGSGSSAPSSLVPAATNENPPAKVFYLNIPSPMIGHAKGLIIPSAGDFYITNSYAAYCPTAHDCPKSLPRPTFFLQQFKTGSYFALNSSVTGPFTGQYKAQIIYIHYTGQLRYLSPPQFFVYNNEPYGNFNITKGVGGAKDTLSFIGNKANRVEPAPFMLCTEVAGPVSGHPLSIHQIYVATPGFKSFVNTTNCVEVVPEITYSTKGVYEWL